MSDKVLSWLWLPATKVEVGQTLTAARLVECASPRALDALRYARGTTICRTDPSGKVLAVADATKTLHEFACWCAEQALLQAGHELDPRSWVALEVKRKWLKGEVTDEELALARDAAWIAAGLVASTVITNAAWAAWAAACAAARATWDDAWDAANTASKDAAVAADWSGEASSADWTMTTAVVRAAQNAKLEEMLLALLEGERDA